MGEKAKAPQGRAERLNREIGKFGAEQSQPQYTHIAEFLQDCQQFEKEVKHFRTVTHEKRTCVYGVAASVPNTDAAALRRTGRYY